MSNRTRMYKQPLETTAEFIDAVHTEKEAVDHLAKITARLEADPTNLETIGDFNRAQAVHQQAVGRTRITPRYVRKSGHESPVHLGK